MKKINKSLSCPYCKAEGRDISTNPVDTATKNEKDNSTIVNIKRTYSCHCNKCQKDYQVSYGEARLTRYKPSKQGTCIGDVRVYVRYESEFDRSYTIADVEGVMMMLIEDDEFPIILREDIINEVINNHKRAKSLAQNTFMNRYR